MAFYSPSFLARLSSALSSQPASATAAGVVKPDGTTTTTGTDGTLSVVQQTLDQISPSAALADTHAIPTLAANATSLGTSTAAQFAAYVATKIPAGATGPAGPAGPVGATGPAGPQGPAAPGNTYATTITADGASASFTVTHGLGTTDVSVQVLDPSNSLATLPLLAPQRPTANTVVVPFSAAPAAGTTFRVIVRS